MRRGIEQGEYIYQCGDLLLGPGDPSASILIDEQSVLFTLVYAKNAGIWPRAKPGEPAQEEKEDKPTSGAAGGGPRVGTGTLEAPPGSFTAEGVLKEALVQLWEQARAKEVKAIGALTIRMFEAGDAFRLLGAVGAVSGAEKIVTITGGYETREEDRLSWSFGVRYRMRSR